MRIRHRGPDPVVGDAHAVVLFIARADASQHDGTGFFIRLFDFHELEPARQGRVFFKVFAVFRPGGGGKSPQFPARQRRLEEVGGIALAGGTAGADERVRLVDEQYRGGRAVFNCVDHVFQAFFELALDRCASLEKPQVKAPQIDVAQMVGHVVIGDPQGKPFDDGGLSHARFTNENGVVFPPAAQNVERLPDFVVAS